MVVGSSLTTNITLYPKMPLYNQTMALRDEPSLPKPRWRMYLVPCSCGTSFAVCADYDRKGTQWSRYLQCPNCGKRHDPKNRIVRLGYQEEGYWKVDEC